MFWLDLYGAALANSKRQMFYSDVLEKVTWQRETRPEMALRDHLGLSGIGMLSHMAFLSESLTLLSSKHFSPPRNHSWITALH
jgi:hypothetical protein